MHASRSTTATTEETVPQRPTTGAGHQNSNSRQTTPGAVSVIGIDGVQDEIDSVDPRYFNDDAAVTADDVLQTDSGVDVTLVAHAVDEEAERERDRQFHEKDEEIDI